MLLKREVGIANLPNLFIHVWAPLPRARRFAQNPRPLYARLTSVMPLIKHTVFWNPRSKYLPCCIVIGNADLGGLSASLPTHACSQDCLSNTLLVPPFLIALELVVVEHSNIVRSVPVVCSIPIIIATTGRILNRFVVLDENGMSTLHFNEVLALDDALNTNMRSQFSVHEPSRGWDCGVLRLVGGSKATPRYGQRTSIRQVFSDKFRNVSVLFENKEFIIINKCNVVRFILKPMCTSVISILLCQVVVFLWKVNNLKVPSSFVLLLSPFPEIVSWSVVVNVDSMEANSEVVVYPLVDKRLGVLDNGANSNLHIRRRYVIKFFLPRQNSWRNVVIVN
mmetsp:Transcript_13090/g.19300  ORF Transcript_13090/g.19300 Transcript_13090/m.19300 type:complete len:337 (-) Transcript_13090:176-1186(-)